MEYIAVLGAGSWGATLATLLAQRPHDVTLWEFDPAAAKALAETRRLPVLPDLLVPPTVRVTSDLAEALKGRAIIISATPSHFVRSTMRSVRERGPLSAQTIVVSVTKGLEEETQKRMSQVIVEELRLPVGRVAVLSGPSHAEEVCRGLPTATVVAGTDRATVTRLQTLFNGEFFRVYAHSDLIGVELGGTLKNVIAIACGISDGLGFGDNTRAALVTRGLNEMTRIGVALGADVQTFFGLAGMGDLVVTCLSQHSRNHRLGEKIGSGKTPAQALSEMTMVAEGYKTAPSSYQLAQQLGLDCPLTREVYAILYEGKNPRTSLHDLLRRETHQEWRESPVKKTVTETSATRRIG